MSRARYGVLGVGEIARAIVTGVCRDVADPPRIVLSPRGARRAAELAQRFTTVSVAPDNAAVVDRSEVVLIAVRPQDLHSVVRDLRFRAEQAVISLVAGVSIPQLSCMLDPVTDIARAIPLPPVADRRGATPVLPPTSAARELFDHLGGAIAVETAAAFDAMSAASATIAAHFAYLDTVARWLGRHGVAPDAASRYVAAIFAGTADALAVSDPDLHSLAGAHATAGGINEQFRSALTDAGTYDAVGGALDAVLERLRSTRPSGDGGPRL